jgi:hypothetical protein
MNFRLASRLQYPPLKKQQRFGTNKQHKGGFDNDAVLDEEDR